MISMHNGVMLYLYPWCFIHSWNYVCVLYWKWIPLLMMAQSVTIIYAYQQNTLFHFSHKYLTI